MNLEVIKDKLGLGEDKLYGVMGAFSEPDELVQAGRRIREMGYTKIDAMSPFPVHGIDDAIGVPPSKLGWIVIWFSALGAATALLLIWYVGAVNYRLVIGGKPFFDFSYSIPVTFELTVLFSAFASFLGMWAINGLPRLYHPSFNYSQAHRASDDLFLLVIEADDPKFDIEKSVDHLRSVGAGDVEVVEG
jgi:ActD protein